MKPALKTTLDRLTPWLLPVALLLAWELAARLGLLSARVLPAPSATARAFWETLLSGALLHHVWVSTQRALIGLAIGGGLGFGLGLLNGVLPVAERLLDSSLQMLRNIPHLAPSRSSSSGSASTRRPSCSWSRSACCSRSTSTPSTASATSTAP